MVIMAQSAANWRMNTHTHVDRMHSLTQLHQHKLQPRGAKKGPSSIRPTWELPQKGKGNMGGTPATRASHSPVRQGAVHEVGEVEVWEGLGRGSRSGLAGEGGLPAGGGEP